MKKTGHKGRYLRFVLYLVVVVLINIAGTTHFFRADLTAGKTFSLSQASETAVATLSDPLTIKVFFTENLPAPYNNIERYLRDLLEEYSVKGNQYFNYQFFNVSAEENEETDKNRETARDYGIFPIQIQNIEQDEVKFQKAYMGMVLIHGDLIEKIPTITSTGGLEYEITEKIRKLNNKISALLNLREKAEVLLFLSSSLEAVGPYLKLPGLSQLPGKIKDIVIELNNKLYGKLEFRYLDPSDNIEVEKEAETYHLLRLHWKDFQDRRGSTVQAGNGFAGLVVRYGKEAEEIRLIRVVKIPIFGTQYNMMNGEQIETAINEALETVININEEVGWLASHGCADISGPSMPGQQAKAPLSNFNELLGESYSIKNINLDKDPIPEGLNALIIAGPKKDFSDYELYQIDQFLMKGKNLILFLDTFKEVMPQTPERMRFRQNQGPVHVPLHTGIEKLMNHYGLSAEPAYVLDESCFKQRVPQSFGGGEKPIYFAPIIKKEWINEASDIMHNLKGLVMLKASPVQVDEQKAEGNDLKPSRLFSSSDRSWEMKGRIDLNPMFLRPPAPDEPRESVPLAYVLEGRFPSYFAGKPIPEKKTQTDDNEQDKGQKEDKGVDTSEVTIAETLKKGKKPGKVFLLGTSEILSNNVIDQAGRSPNAQFLMNVVDVFNNREAYALMRTKSQLFNPMEEIEPGTKTFIKSFNIVGLPVLVILTGLVVWLRRLRRKQTIQSMFSQ